MSSVRILGIDPGSILCGYGIVEQDERRRLTHLGSGVIALPRKKPLHMRLMHLYEDVRNIVRLYEPQQVVVEKVFFAKGVKAALHLGHARGVVLLAVAEEGVELQEYSPNEIKKAVVGYGRAEKCQVQKMVQTILSLDGIPSPDSADALALAICHVNTMNFRSCLAGPRGPF
ncbi:MAG: crossover junction endodeoxyribonuclease RuvC [Nitrospirae bacterium]|nr:crossover junction endodeoxyribonuclease RuvC [Nitrospirota bacterium]